MKHVSFKHDIKYDQEEIRREGRGGEEERKGAVRGGERREGSGEGERGIIKH